MMIVDTDTHVTEPPDLWTSRMSKQRWGALIPEVRHIEERGDYWCVGGRPLFPAGTSMMVKGENGNPVRSPTFPRAPATIDLLHPSSYDPRARLDVMDRYGISAAVLFPNLGFVGPNIYAAAGPDALDFQTEALRTYNDFILEWSSVDPNRLLAMACIPYWDVDAAVAEIQRAAEMGHKGLVSTGKPHEHGQPLLIDRHWDPMWAAAQDAGLSISFHVGGGDLSRHFNEERIMAEGYTATTCRIIPTFFFESGIGLADLLMSGVLARFPRLKFASVESAIGWVPCLLESLDYHFKKLSVWNERPEFGMGDMLPSDYFRRQVYTNFWFEDLKPWHLEAIGEDSLLFETDYPHPTCLDAAEVDAVVEGLAWLPESARDKLLWKNAASLYGLQAVPT